MCEAVKPFVNKFLLMTEQGTRLSHVALSSPAVEADAAPDTWYELSLTGIIILLLLLLLVGWD
jgi:hypothetical protein